MPRFKLTIEYAGTRYSGWQIQKNARTVQGEIDRAVREVAGGRTFELYGSGRTGWPVTWESPSAKSTLAGVDSICTGRSRW